MSIGTFAHPCSLVAEALVGALLVEVGLVPGRGLVEGVAGGTVAGVVHLRLHSVGLALHDGVADGHVVVAVGIAQGAVDEGTAEGA